jgi:hypothetical protein
VQYDFTSIRIENDGKAADRSFSNLPSESNPQFQKTGDLSIEIGNFERHHCSSGWNRVFLIRRSDGKRRVSQVILKPLAQGFVRELESEDILVEVARSSNVADRVSDEGERFNHRQGAPLSSSTRSLRFSRWNKLARWLTQARQQPTAPISMDSTRPSALTACYGRRAMRRKEGQTPMTKVITSAPARIHLLPAKEAPVVVVIRRKPSRLFHVIRINTETGSYEQGAWFTGKLYAMRCDVSFDGNWFVYLALGAKGQTWNGISMLPRLACVAESENLGTWFGGGYWSSRKVLRLNGRAITKGKVPFQIEPMASEYGSEDLGVVYPRLERDGWRRCGDNWGKDREVTCRGKYTVECVGDDGWDLRPSQRHPSLHLWYAGYLKHGYTFRFRIREDAEFLDDTVDWAAYDSLGQLVVARKGAVSVYRVTTRSTFRLRYEFDFEPLKPKKPGAD